MEKVELSWTFLLARINKIITYSLNMKQPCKHSVKKIIAASKNIPAIISSLCHGYRY
jgi:hypothetical protein